MEVKSECVSEWSCEDVGSWLVTNGFDQYVEEFSKHGIDGQVLLTLTEKDLRDPPMSIYRLGDIKRLTIRLNTLKGLNRASQSNLTSKEAAKLNYDSRHTDRLQTNSYKAHTHLYHTRQDSVESDEFESLIHKDSELDMRSSSSKNCPLSDNLCQEIPAEPWKTALSFVYIFVTFLVTAFVMVVVHDRVPEMDKYPPLPDLFLDNMPYVSWAFEACEMVGLVLSVMWFTLLFFHKYRFVLMRRWFSLMGTIFLLRCVTMLITSLSVPGKHLQCSGGRYGDFYSRLNRAFEIWCGFGMSMQGVRTCGDYMFSGHTSIITLLNFFITEYTPRKFYFVHIMSWCLNFFGIFFLLAAHEHYSIDVFMAFYLSSRLFMYYHSLANNRALMQADANRTRIWFPLFSFFESKCQGRVPNHLEWPLRGLLACVKQATVSLWSAGSSLGQHVWGEAAEEASGGKRE